MRVAVIGAGWAGCAAAVELARLGHEPVLLEAAPQAGGRARRLSVVHSGRQWTLDNGQHILIGAYRDTLQLMSELGMAPGEHLRRLPLALHTPDGAGLSLPSGWPASLAALSGVLRARGWSWTDKASLLQQALRWRSMRFECPPEWSVARLCEGLAPAVHQALVEPLCVSALNTPPERASAQVFLRVMSDSLFSGAGAADLLLPTTDLSALLPDAAERWLRARGHGLQLGQRVQALQRRTTGWELHTAQQSLQADALVMACPANESARLMEQVPGTQAWTEAARGLAHEAIATVYVESAGTRLMRPMLALSSSAQAPAQFVFDRGQLGGPPGLLAFVVSASQGGREEIEAAVLSQARSQLGLQAQRPLSTVVEKRATFACTPGLHRPGRHPVPGQADLLACGDYVAGPYPATLEGAVRSGLEAARALHGAARAIRSCATAP